MALPDPTEWIGSDLGAGRHEIREHEHQTVKALLKTNEPMDPRANFGFTTGSRITTDVEKIGGSSLKLIRCF